MASPKQIEETENFFFRYGNSDVFKSRTQNLLLRAASEAQGGGMLLDTNILQDDTLVDQPVVLKNEKNQNDKL